MGAPKHLAELLAAYDDWCTMRACHARAYRRAQIGECPMTELAWAASCAAAAGRRFHSAVRAAKAALDAPSPDAPGFAPAGEGASAGKAGVQ